MCRCLASRGASFCCLVYRKGRGDGGGGGSGSSDGDGGVGYSEPLAYATQTASWPCPHRAS